MHAYMSVYACIGVLIFNTCVCMHVHTYVYVLLAIPPSIEVGRAGFAPPHIEKLPMPMVKNQLKQNKTALWSLCKIDLS